MSNINFKSKYPIMLAAMNQVSTLDFAIAASNAGIFPSISGFNYYVPKQYKKKLEINLEKLKKDLQIFNELTGSNDLILSIELLDIFKDEFKELCSLNLFSHIEVIDETRYILSAELYNDTPAFEKLEKHFSIVDSFGIPAVCKILNSKHWINKSERSQKMFSGAIIKSKDAAGLVDDDERKPLEEEIKILKEYNPHKTFIPSGGIYSSKQVKKYINAGAKIVSVGSFFTVAEESPISIETKNRILSSTNVDIKKFNSTNRNSIIFSKILDDDANHTNSLRSGIINPSSGHIFMGSAVDHINKIKPLKDLVQELISDLS